MTFEAFLTANGFVERNLEQRAWVLGISGNTSLIVKGDGLCVRRVGVHDISFPFWHTRTTDAEDREVINRWIVALRMLAGQSPWLPMETAPTDGTEVLLVRVYSDQVQYVTSASWGFDSPGFLHCASYSGWFPKAPFTTDPTKKVMNEFAINGVISQSCQPTGWMPLPITWRGNR